MGRNDGQIPLEVHSVKWLLLLLSTLAVSAQIPPMVMQDLLAAAQPKAAAAAPFSPSDLAGLRLWYKGDTLTNTANADLVMYWTDSSGNGFHIAPSDSSYAPWFTNSPYNGVVAHASSSKYLTVSLNSTNLINGNLQTVFAVFSNLRLSTANSVIYTRSGTEVNNIAAVYSPAYPTYNAIGTADPNRLYWDNSAGTNIAGLHIWEGWMSGANMKFVLDGTQIASRANANATAAEATVSFYLAKYNDGDGVIYEFINYNVALSDSDRTKVRNYLLAKYVTNQ